MRIRGGSRVWLGLFAAVAAAGIGCAMPGRAAADATPCPAPGPAGSPTPCAASPSPSPSQVPPTVVISPFQGRPGTPISVTGSHFAPSEVVAIYWDSPGVAVAQVTTGPGGAFAARFRAPSGSASNHAVCAQESGQPYCDVFQLLPAPSPPTMRISPPRAAPGSTVTVSATGLPPGLSLTFAIGARTGAARATVGADGTAKASFQVPSIPAGPAPVCATGAAAALCVSLVVLAPSAPPAAVPVAAAASSPGPPMPLFLALAALAVAGGAWWILRARRRPALPATVKHRLGESSLSSTHPEYWGALSDPSGGPAGETPAGGAAGATGDSQPAPGSRRRAGGSPPRRLGRRRR